MITTMIAFRYRFQKVPRVEYSVGSDRHNILVTKNLDFNIHG